MKLSIALTEGQHFDQDACVSYKHSNVYTGLPWWEPCRNTTFFKIIGNRTFFIFVLSRVNFHHSCSLALILHLIFQMLSCLFIPCTSRLSWAWLCSQLWWVSSERSPMWEMLSGDLLVGHSPLLTCIWGLQKLSEDADDKLMINSVASLRWDFWQCVSWHSGHASTCMWPHTSHYF